MAQPSKGKKGLEYSDGDTVLAFQGSLLWEAKIIDVRSDLVAPYKIHYQGWKKRHDEWVGPSQVMPHTPENVQHMKELKSVIQKKNQESKKRKSIEKAQRQAGTKSDGSSQQAKRRKGDSTIDSHIQTVNMKDTLRVILVDDWHNVTKNKKILTLPRHPSITEILSQYCGSQHPPKRRPKYDEFSEGMRAFFDVAIGVNLLYKEERAQYEDQLRLAWKKHGADSSPSMSDVYGGEHLLRLLVKLPSLFSDMNGQGILSQNAQGAIMEQTMEFQDFIDSRRDDIFKKANYKDMKA